MKKDRENSTVVRRGKRLPRQKNEPSLAALVLPPPPRGLPVPLAPDISRMSFWDRVAHVTIFGVLSFEHYTAPSGLLRYLFKLTALCAIGLLCLTVLAMQGATFFRYVAQIANSVFLASQSFLLAVVCLVATGGVVWFTGKWIHRKATRPRREIVLETEEPEVVKTNPTGKSGRKQSRKGRHRE